MKFAKLLHNPQSGNGQTTEKDLLRMIRSEGFECSYSSTKQPGWEKIESKHLDFIVVAGGDGTIRKAAAKLLNKKLLDKKLPIGLIPLGTANNIAKTLGITGTSETIVQSWREKKLKKFDVGRVRGLRNVKFFLEGFGFGVFPRLITTMERLEAQKIKMPEKDIQTALEVLHEIVCNYKAKYCTIKVDDKEHTGDFLLVEIMNIKSIGPNLSLAPFADPGDGEFEVILIAATQRDVFCNYIRNKMQGIDQPTFFTTLKAKNIEVYWEGTEIHVDDATMRLKKTVSVQLEMHEGVLDFFVQDARRIS